MPIFIQGRIEYLAMSYEITDANEAHTWQSWMDISSIITFNDEINWKIFGNPRNFEDENVPCIAKNRGFPKNPGEDLERDIKNILSNNSQELFGFKHFLYSEIKSYNWKSKLSKYRSK